MVRIWLLCSLIVFSINSHAEIIKYELSSSFTGFYDFQNSIAVDVEFDLEILLDTSKFSINSSGWPNGATSTHLTTGAARLSLDVHNEGTLLEYLGDLDYSFGSGDSDYWNIYAFPDELGLTAVTNDSDFDLATLILSYPSYDVNRLISPQGLDLFLIDVGYNYDTPKHFMLSSNSQHGLEFTFRSHVVYEPLSALLLITGIFPLIMSRLRV